MIKHIIADWMRRVGSLKNRNPLANRPARMVPSENPINTHEKEVLNIDDYKSQY
jgi:hypothetical protein